MNSVYPDISGMSHNSVKRSPPASASMLSPPDQQLATPKSSPDWPSRSSPESESPEDQVLACHWAGCSNVYDDVERLYAHLCDDHVGRKSTRNLSLVCKWDDCDVSTAKRDHITSHIRIHIPLKPYKCQHCTKTFKRPQDLKKHTRTHTASGASRKPYEESYKEARHTGAYVPAPNAYGQPMPQYGAYGAQPPVEPYGSAMPPMYGNYGSGYYGNDTLSGMVRSTQPYEEGRKRALDMTYDLISDVKRSRVAPQYSSTMAQRINAMSPLMQGPVPSAQDVNRLASLPARDLSVADDFLNQLSMNLSRKTELFGYSPAANAAMQANNAAAPPGSLPSPEESLNSSLYPSLPWEKQYASQVPRFDHDNTGRRLVIGNQRASPNDKNEVKKEVMDDNNLSDDEDKDNTLSSSGSSAASPVPVPDEADSPKPTSESPPLDSPREEALNALRVISVLRNLLSQASEMKKKQESELYPPVQVK